MDLTPEQQAAVDAREGDLLLAAGAGSGKTRVLAERFAQAVAADGLPVGSLLAITFTEKAAAELADRVRRRLRELGRDAEAREAETGWIGTIHGFCARVLRTHPVAAGIDPRFRVLDEVEAAQLETRAFDAALKWEDVPLLTAYGRPGLRAAVTAVHAELRARGLPPRLPDPGPAATPPEAAERLRAALAAFAAEGLSAKARAVVERCGPLLEAGLDPAPTPDALGDLELGTAASTRTPEGEALRAALEALRAACADAHARPVWAGLAALLERHVAAYEEAKRARSGLDFSDLELHARALLSGSRGLRERYRGRFERIMVDEFQDTNPLQLEILRLIERQNLFTVGDEHQAIYGFRHADVEHFRARQRALAPKGRALALHTSFRARPALLAVLNETFAEVLSPPPELLPGRAEPERAPGPAAELLLTDRGADWGPRATAETAPPWRVAEARALAARIRALIDAGRPARDIVVLLRATGDMSTYERALTDRGVPTYVIGGRGYWAQREVQDLVAWLTVLANPREELRLLEVLASPLCGLKADALVALGAARREEGRDLWRAILRGRAPSLELLVPAERERLAAFAAWAAAERAAAPELGIEAGLERAVHRSRFDLTLARAPGGRRRLANVRKLMRLAREWELEEGPDLRGFLALVAERTGLEAAESREGEAPIESEELDAVRLMTIHRAKGLEFPVVCVADLGRGRPGDDNSVIQLERRGPRVGLRLAIPGTGGSVPAFALRALREENRREAEAEERRLFYVALTRAQDHLVLSGAVDLGRWPEPEQGPPVAWLAPALVPDIHVLAAGPEASGVSGEVAFALHRPPAEGEEAPAPAPPPLPVAPEPPPALVPAAASLGAAPVDHVSYSSLAAYARCAYRFYLERVLRLPAREDPADRGKPSAEPGLAATTRGSIAHTLLERLDLAAPVVPSDAELDLAAALHGAERLTEAERTDLRALVAGFPPSPLGRRLAGAARVGREVPFAFSLDGLLVTGVFDALAPEPAGGLLVLDYKTNRLTDRSPREVVGSDYAVQRLVYALAALRSGTAGATVAYAFLEAPQEPVEDSYPAADAPRLEAELRGHVRGIAAQEFPVATAPDRELCHGCPGRGTVCSWPREDTLREPDAPPGPGALAGTGAPRLF